MKSDKNNVCICTTTHEITNKGKNKKSRIHSVLENKAGHIGTNIIKLLLRRRHLRQQLT